MRIPGLRALLALACIALVAIAFAGPAYALFLNLLPENPFIGSKAKAESTFGSSGHDFFSAAMGAIPGSDKPASSQINTIFNLKKAISLPSFTSSGDSWMSGMSTFGAKPLDLSNSSIDTGYVSMIKRFDNQSNIFEY